jgi:hypothetical protein
MAFAKHQGKESVGTKNDDGGEAIACTKGASQQLRHK